MTVAGIVLAAGHSTRMGPNKLLLQLGGESLVRRAARAARDAGLAPILVVLGHDADRVAEEVRGLGCGLVPNPRRAETASGRWRAMSKTTSRLSGGRGRPGGPSGSSRTCAPSPTA